MSARLSQILRFVVYPCFGVALLSTLSLPLSCWASVVANEPFLIVHQGSDRAKLTSPEWTSAALPDGLSLRAFPESHRLANTDPESGSDGDAPFGSRPDFKDVGSRDGNLIAQAPFQPRSRNPAQLESAGRYTYRETFESTDPREVLGGVLDVGSEGAWTATLTGASYQLVNQSNPYDVVYYYVLSLPGQPPGPISQGTASVVVTVQGEGDHAGAGLLFALDPETYYYALVATIDGYAFYRRDEDGFQKVISAQSSLVNQGASNRLAIAATGPELQLFVNDQRIARIDRADPVDGGIGIIALSTGTYTFEEFTYAAPEPKDHVGRVLSPTQNRGYLPRS